MATKSSEPEFAALQSLYQALKPLDDVARKRVLSSLFALLGITETSPNAAQQPPAAPQPGASAVSTLPGAPALAARPLSLVELVQQKDPTTNAQRIALFAYYREKHENLPRFARADLERYFALARLSPSANFDRDFVETVKKGWIHEDGADSYLTSKGVEAVESGFAGERKYTKPAGGAAKKRSAVPKRSPRKKAKR